MDWSWHAKDGNYPLPSAVPGLTLGQSLVVGALCDLVMNARYPQMGCGDLMTADVTRLLGQSPAQLRELGITGPLADLVRALAKQPTWQGRLRRCLYQFARKSGRWGKGCLMYFVDESPAGNARGCRTSHTVAVHVYEHGVNDKTRRG
jgi:hypothetical protein